nr:WYL domain-containing protein [Nakamurella flavida]
MFERDKQELRELGIPLQTPPGTDDGYRIAAVDFTLPQLSFTPAEAAALALAGRLWETTVLGEAGSGALRKIRDAAGPGTPTDTVGTDVEASAADLLQPRVRTSDPAFTPLYAAVRAGKAVSFAYRKEVGGPTEPRALEPWGLVSFRGRWYVIGRDRGRGERRTFRLSRIVGPVKAVGRAGAVQAPAGVDLLAEVAASVERPSARTGTVRIRSGRAAGLRRSALNQLETPAGATPGTDDWDVVEIPVGHLWDTARMIAGHGPDVVVLTPPDLADAVVRLLSGLATPVAAGRGDGHE